MTIKKLIFFERQLVVLNVVGSSPTFHPIKWTRSFCKDIPRLCFLVKDK